MAIVGIMLALMALFAVIALIEPMKTVVDDARNSDNLNCPSAPSYNVSKTSETLTCWAVDLLIPWFFITTIAVAIGWIAIRRLGGRRREAEYSE